MQYMPPCVLLQRVARPAPHLHAALELLQALAVCGALALCRLPLRHERVCVVHSSSSSSVGSCQSHHVADS
jgi:hypothetical protein